MLKKGERVNCPHCYARVISYSGGHQTVYGELDTVQVLVSRGRDGQGASSRREHPVHDCRPAFSPLNGRCVAIRFSAPLMNGILEIRASQFVSPRNLRIRGSGVLEQASVHDVDVFPGNGILLDTFADAHGIPLRPGLFSENDMFDDSSDGPPVNWPVFGTDAHPLKLKLKTTTDDHPVLGPTQFHVILTVELERHQFNRPYMAVQAEIACPFPPPLQVAFRYTHEETWNTANVLDYATRSPLVGARP